MEHIVAILVLTVAVIYDRKSYRIPNAWILMGFGAGLILAILRDGSKGFFDGLLRAAIPIVALYILF